MADSKQTAPAEATPQEIARAVKTNAEVVVLMPKGVTGVSHEGEEYEVGKDGKVKVTARHAVILAESHGGTILAS